MVAELVFYIAIKSFIKIVIAQSDYSHLNSLYLVTKDD